jgi:hypothetical protein
MPTERRTVGPRPGHPLLPSLFLVFPIVQFLSFGVRVTIFVPLVPIILVVRAGFLERQGSQ